MTETKPTEKTEMTDGVVVLGFGPQPMDFFSKAMKVCGKDSVCDPDVARMAGANLAVGAPAALAALRKRLEAGSLGAAEQECHGSGLSPAAINWLAAGRHGLSSQTIFSVVTGHECNEGRRDIPHDPDDLGRCRRLLDACPEIRAELHRMSAVSPTWAALVESWNELCNLMDEEAPLWREGIGDCPKTYERMEQLIESAEKNDR